MTACYSLLCLEIDKKTSELNAKLMKKLQYINSRIDKLNTVVQKITPPIQSAPITAQDVVTDNISNAFSQLIEKFDKANEKIPKHELSIAQLEKSLEFNRNKASRGGIPENHTTFVPNPWQSVKPRTDNPPTSHIQTTGNTNLANSDDTSPREQVTE